MATGSPLTGLALAASSVADDLGYVAMSDLAKALGDLAADYRVIGGHMVTMLAARWQLGAGLYRETGDLDLGVPPIVARDKGVVRRIKDASYLQVAGNRFARRMGDIPAGIRGERDSPSPEAVIDVLIPAYTSRARQNVQVGEDLFTTEVPGLHLALARPAVSLALTLRRLNGQTLDCELPFADEVSALVLKSLATKVRFKDTDIADTWRCLEIAFAAGLRPPDFAGSTRFDAAETVRSLFRDRNGQAMQVLARQQHLSGAVADERHTRIRALIATVLGSA
jgi:hypothetical protein